MISVYNSLLWAKEKIWGKPPWSMEVTLENYYIYTFWEEKVGNYTTSIYHTDFYKNPLRSTRVKYIAISKDAATRWHYAAIKQVVDIETGRHGYYELNWVRE